MSKKSVFFSLLNSLYEESGRYIHSQSGHNEEEDEHTVEKFSQYAEQMQITNDAITLKMLMCVCVCVNRK